MTSIILQVIIIYMSIGDGQESFLSLSTTEESKLGEPPVNESKLSEDFDYIWDIYPKKEGKQAAYTHYKNWLKGKEYCGKKTKLTNLQMWHAVNDYAASVKGKEEKYIKHGSTFFNGAIMDFVRPHEELEREKEVDT